MYIPLLQDMLANKTILFLLRSVHSNIGKKLISYKGPVIWRELNAEYSNLPFHQYKKLCVIIGYLSPKFFV